MAQPHLDQIYRGLVLQGLGLRYPPSSHLYQILHYFPYRMGYNYSHSHHCWDQDFAQRQIHIHVHYITHLPHNHSNCLDFHHPHPGLHSHCTHQAHPQNNPNNHPSPHRVNQLTSLHHRQPSSFGYL